MEIAIFFGLAAIVGAIIWGVWIVARPERPPPGACSPDNWCWQNPLPHADDFGATCFKRTGDGRVLGWMLVEGRRVLYSDDGGQSWRPQDIDLEEHEFLSDLCFVDTTHGWAVSYKNFVIHTADGGNTWVRQELGPDAGDRDSLVSVTFVDQQNGWIAGSADDTERGHIFHTSDGGQTWSLQYEGGNSRHLRDIVFVDALRGWAVGDSLTFLRTTDGGTTWVAFPSTWIDNPEGLLAFGGNLHCVAFTPDGVHGWAMRGRGPGGNVVFRTMDGGQSWSAHSMQISNYPPEALQSHHSFSIDMVDSQHGWAVGCGHLRSAPINDDFGAILHTRDGGLTWTEQLGWLMGASSGGHTNGMKRWLTHVEALDAQQAWVVGQLGTLLHTTNGGGTWFESTHYATTDNLVALGLLAEQHLVVLGGHGIARTEDGVTWEEQQTDLPKYAEYKDMAAYGPNLWVAGRICYAMGLPSYPCLYRSSDNGRSWTLQASLVDIGGNDFSPSALMHMSIDRVLFVDDLHGWAKGHFVNYSDPNDPHIDTVLFRTIDGGVSWVQFAVSSYPDVDAFFFLDSHKGWATTAVAPGTLLRTEDSGNSWSEQASGTDARLRVFTFVDPDYGWVAGDGATVVATTDGGQSWSEVHYVDPCDRWRRRVHGVVFSDRLNGWIIGEGTSWRSMILRTVDGGKTWSEDESGAMARLSDIVVNTKGEIWVSGWGGAVLYHGA